MKNGSWLASFEVEDANEDRNGKITLALPMRRGEEE